MRDRGFGYVNAAYILMHRGIVLTGNNRLKTRNGKLYSSFERTHFVYRMFLLSITAGTKLTVLYVLH